jgi:hypothetical protein
MIASGSLKWQFGCLWAAYAVSTFGTWLAFDAFSLIAILALHVGPAEVSVLAASGLAVGAVIAVPLGPWMEFRRKRPVMIAMDLMRLVALMSVPAAFALGWLSFAQLLLVTCMGVFNPVFATYRLDQAATDRVARTLSAWSVTSNATIAAMTAGTRPGCRARCGAQIAEAQRSGISIHTAAAALARRGAQG